MPAYDFVAGDTLSKIHVTIRRASDGTLMDLTGCTVQLRYRIDGDGNTLRTKTMTPLNQTTNKGEAEYLFLAGELVAGAMKGEVTVTSAGLVVTTLEEFKYLIRPRV